MLKSIFADLAVLFYRADENLAFCFASTVTKEIQTT